MLTRSRPSLTIAVIYLAAAAAWFAIVEVLSPALVPLEGAENPVLAGIVKGILFLGVTAVALYFLVARVLDAAARAREAAAGDERRDLSKTSPAAVAERGAGAERQAYAATHDALTGLPNAGLLKDRMEQAMVHSRRTNRSVAVLVLDFDHLVTINVSYGTRVGDAILKEAAGRLQSAVRPGDTVARVGGDEFAIALCDLRSPTDIGSVMERIGDAIRGPYQVEDQEIVISMSGGIAVHPDDGLDGDSLLQHASAAAHQAKRKPGTYEYYTESISVESRERVGLHRALRRALEQREFELHYQPQVDARSGHIVGCEALLRWRTSEFGAVPPGRFIPLAEDTGLIVPIGAWVLAAACRQCMAWNQWVPNTFGVSVNVSGRQFHRGDLVFQVRSALEESSLDPSRLEIELTESVILGDREEVIRVIRDLKEIGVKLSIDDFGTGYSSLSYVKRFRVDRLKIDQSFVQGLAQDRGDASIAQAIITLSHNFRMSVVAEGVESPEQARLLAGWGCDQLQGYLFSPPVDGLAFAALLGARKPFSWAA